MKHLFLSVLCAAIAGCSGCVTFKVVEQVDPSTTTHHLDMGCGATATGPHTILTATHCGVEELKAIDGVPVKVLDVFHDGNDHTGVLVDITFDRWATISTVPLRQGERVRMWGNPGILRYQYREGYVSGTCPLVECFPVQAKSKDLILFDLHIWKGDSGSGMFDDAGNLRSVVSMIYGAPSFSPAGTLPFAFTQEQLQDLRR